MDFLVRVAFVHQLHLASVDAIFSIPAWVNNISFALEHQLENHGKVTSWKRHIRASEKTWRTGGKWGYSHPATSKTKMDWHKLKHHYRTAIFGIPSFKG